MGNIVFRLEPEWSAQEVADQLMSLMRATGMPGVLGLNEYVATQRESFLSILEPAEREACSAVPVVSVPTRDKNSWVMPASRRSDWFIVIDSQFFSELIWAASIVTSKLEVRQRVVSIACLAFVGAHPELWDSVPLHLLITEAEFLGGTVPATTDAGVSICWGSLAGSIAAKFVIAHEYGHVLCGHLGRMTSRVFFGNRVKVAALRCEQEIDADIKAIDLLSRLPLVDYSGALVAADMLFRFLMIIEAVRFPLVSLGLKPPVASSHPPTENRRERVLERGGVILRQLAVRELNPLSIRLANTAYENIYSDQVAQFWDTAQRIAAFIGISHHRESQETIVAAREFCEAIHCSPRGNPSLTFYEKILDIVGILDDIERR